MILRWITGYESLAELVASLPAFALVILVAVCIVVISKGADWMIDGVVKFAQQTGLPRIVIGATIVSLGTTTPEAVVSVAAAWMGNPGLALGNGVGSIICDTGMIFGLTCLLAAPVPANPYILNRTGWVQVGAATLLVVISVISLAITPESPVLSRSTGFFLLLLLACYLYVSYVWAKQAGDVGGEEDRRQINVGRALGELLGGLTCVVVGARLLIPSAAELARRMQVPDDVVAASIVAFGTSIPELVTAVAAVRKGHPEITVGNIVGADVLNCLFVIGAAAAARPLTVPPNFFYFHFPAMLVILYSFRVFIGVNRGKGFTRRQGGWLFGVYLLYIVLQYALSIGSAESHSL